MDFRAGIIGIVMVSVVFCPFSGEAGPLAGAVARGAAKSAARALRGGSPQTLRRDLLRDRATRAHRLPSPRTVFRFTSKERAQQELKKGIPPGAHMTSRGGPGRPLSSEAAKRKYGLPQRPEVRETVRLPKGQPTRSNRALGGDPGVGETTSSKKVPPEAIKNVVPLRPTKD